MIVTEGANKQDISRIVEIDKKAFGVGGVSEKMIKSQLEVFPEGILIAKEGGEVVGVVCCERHKEQTFPSYGHDVSKTHSKEGSLIYLSVITVAEEFRNKGIGSLLLEKVSDLAKELGILKIYCPVNKKHPYLEKGVFHFWKKNGYEIVSETKWEVAPDRFIDSYILEKSFS